MPTNEEFVNAIFGRDAAWCHVTDFPYDPGNIPKERHLHAWKGDYFSRYTFSPNTNQYFTISAFYCDDQGTARRRKALYRYTPCIVLDDVREKLSMDEVQKLPQPSWILETSPGSEQWGYILDEPCAERGRVENLLDGLVANGLAPDGRDPGMKGVTRYVRLPEGVNNKAAKLVNGQPFKCRMLEWHPFNTVTLEQLATPFNVNLDAARREQRVDGAAAVADHPLLQIPDLIHVKEVRSDGRFDITCPWVDEHTGADDSGAAVFTNDDGSIGFKCHHGACQHRSGRDLLRNLETQKPGFGSEFAGWKAVRAFKGLGESFISSDTDKYREAVDTFMEPLVNKMTQLVNDNFSFIDPVTPAAEPQVNGMEQMLDALRRERPTTPEARDISTQILKIVEELPQIEKVHWYDEVCDLMHWNKTDFKDILNDLRKQWYGEKIIDADFYNTVIFVKELNQFYDWTSRIFFSVEAFQNAFSHEDPEARKTALQDGQVQKVDRLDYAPKKPRTFIERNIVYGNTWYAEDEIPGYQGDVSRWLNHWDTLGWGQHRKHMMQWMAYTLLHPEEKINHMLLLGSGEGCGKDFLLYPLMKATGDNGMVISGEELLEPFNDYLLSTKYLHINETELGDRKEAVAVSNKLKPLATAPPDRLRVNSKNVKHVKVRNIINATMTTNSQMPIRLNGMSRRFYAVWSDLTTRDEYDQTLPEWEDYWEDRWDWMKQGGAEACVWYLRNCVDLSDFKPAAAPPMTEFLREIAESSKSPAQQTIEAFIRRGIGAFKADLVTSADAAATLKAGDLTAPDLMYCDSKAFTPNKVGAVMKDIQFCVKLRARRGLIESRPWAIRNTDRYKSLSTSDLLDEYEKQTLQARAATPLTIVS